MESFRPSRGSKIRDWGTRGSNQKDRFRPEHRSPGLGNLSCSGVRWGGKSSKVELRFVWLVSLEGRFECVGVFPRGNPKQLSTSLGSSWANLGWKLCLDGAGFGHQFNGLWVDEISRICFWYKNLEPIIWGLDFLKRNQIKISLKWNIIFSRCVGVCLFKKYQFSRVRAAKFLSMTNGRYTQQCLVCHRQCPGWVAQKTRCLFLVLLSGKTFHFPRKTNGSKVQKKMPPVCVCVHADLREMMCNGEKMG